MFLLVLPAGLTFLGEITLPLLDDFAAKFPDQTVMAVTTIQFRIGARVA